jgi:DNA-binding NarL/FixJ family response regulator
MLLIPHNQEALTVMATDIAEVWLVEDNEFYRNTIQSVLNDSGKFQCLRTFGSCEDALAALETEPPPSLVLMDVGLPGMSGIEGIGRFKFLTPSTPILILTVYDDDDKVFNALCSGASGYLLKSAPKEKVIEALQEALSGGAPMNPAIAKKVLSMFSRLGSVPKSSNYGLTAREKEILQHMVTGLTKKEIAEKLFLSFHTVNTHLKNIYSKLQVSTRTGAVSKAFREKLL